MTPVTSQREAEDQSNDLEVTRRIDDGMRKVIQESVADSTEVLWLDKKKQRASINVPDFQGGLWRSRTVEVRVLQSGRFGQHRLGSNCWHEVASAVRLAMAHATAAATRSPPRRKFQPQPPALESARTFDRKIARLDQRSAEELLEGFCKADEAATAEWYDGQVVLRNSEGLALTQRVTSLQVEVRSGLGPGAGFASDAVRRLDDLDLEGLFARARRRRATDQPGELDQTAVPVVLAPEATAELVEMLNQRAFSAQAYSEGTSFLREHLGVQVFDARLFLEDDGCEERGLPFPFDLEGRAKRRTMVVDAGVPRTPILDSESAMECGLEPTGHGVCAGTGYGLNLFMREGTASEEELLSQAEGGIWISRIERIECFDPSRMLIRGKARGIRRIGKGELAQPIPDQIWEDSLLRIFASFGELGRTTARRLSADGVLGGICAPAVLLGSVQGLRNAPAPL